MWPTRKNLSRSRPHNAQNYTSALCSQTVAQHAKQEALQVARAQKLGHLLREHSAVAPHVLIELGVRVEEDAVKLPTELPDHLLPACTYPKGMLRAWRVSEDLHESWLASSQQSLTGLCSIASIASAGVSTHPSSTGASWHAKRSGAGCEPAAKQDPHARPFVPAVPQHARMDTRMRLRRASSVPKDLE